jgi:hypothetical protein
MLLFAKHLHHLARHPFWFAKLSADTVNALYKNTSWMGGTFPPVNMELRDDEEKGLDVSVVTTQPHSMLSTTAAMTSMCRGWSLADFATLLLSSTVWHWIVLEWRHEKDVLDDKTIATLVQSNANLRTLKLECACNVSATTLLLIGIHLSVQTVWLGPRFDEQPQQDSLPSVSDIDLSVLRAYAKVSRAKETTLIHGVLTRLSARQLIRLARDTKMQWTLLVPTAVASELMDLLEEDEQEHPWDLSDYSTWGDDLQTEGFDEAACVISTHMYA